MSESEAAVLVGLPAKHDDPAVIVGMACRLPGDIASPSDLWDFIMQQKSASGTVPLERYNIDGFYHPDGGHRSGLTNVPGGYFLKDDVRKFDNGFFGISNLEATYLDPQQRKLLEISYEALENAGVALGSLAGSSTGVFVANFSVDYQPMLTRDPDYAHRYVAAGSGATNMSNRISHIFDLHGPSFTIDTACSSSVYALHEALNAMKANDCESAIVSSANMVLSPEMHIAAAKSGVLSPTATCHTFDASADGYGRAEGVSSIYIKRLSAALRDGNPIRAIIRGSATNASGRTAGISLPSGEQQEKVMRKAYRNAGLDLSGTDYVECHGTGTPVGDPIEVNAVGKTFAPEDRPSPLLIGSVKTNVGHSEGSSGLTSILKVVKAFEHGVIPPSRGVVKVNPKLILKERNVKIATQVEQWPRALRRASINSFGYGGANAHVILEAPESYLGQSHFSKLNIVSHSLNGDVRETADEEQNPGVVVLPVSAASTKSLEGGLKRMSDALASWQGRDNAKKLQRLAYTLSNGRDHLRQRGFLLAGQSASGSIELVKLDEAAASGKTTKLPFGFVFTGQGAQYAGMAKELLVQNQHFLDTIRTLDAVLKALPAPYAPSWTLEQTLLDGPSTSKINEVTRSQPICTAVQIGLVDLLRSWGITPTSVVGHSSGEIAAAYAAGLLTASEAILSAYFRGYAVGELRAKGAMMAAGMGPDAAKALIETLGLVGKVRVACVNSPESVTLSGSVEGIEALKKELDDQKKFARKLETGGRAYHSHMMEEIGNRYQELLSSVFTRPGESKSSRLPADASMYSSVGHSPDGLRVLDATTDMAAYWRQNLEQPVQFSAALTNLTKAANGKIHLIELGPHSALKGPIQQIQKAMGVKKDASPYSSTLVRKSDANLCIKTLAGTLYTYGHTLNWNKVNSLSDSGMKTLVDLPSYDWDYSGGILWSEPRASFEMRNRKNLRHELLGTLALTGNGIDYTWRNILKPSEMPWIEDHKLEDRVLFPAAGYMAIAIEAVLQMENAKGDKAAAFEFRNVNISAALPVPDENDAAAKDLELHTTMSRRKISTAQSSADWHDFSISSWAAGETTLHCSGSIRITRAVTTVSTTGVTVAKTDSFEAGPASRWYRKWAEEGMCFGPYFQSILTYGTDASKSAPESIGTVSLLPPKETEGTDYPLHPITLDSCLQAPIWSTAHGHVPSLKAWLPVFIAECRVQRPQLGEDLVAELHSRSEVTGVTSRTMDCTLRDGNGVAVVELRGARISLYSGAKSSSTSSTTQEEGQLDLYGQRQPTLRVTWKPDVLRLSAASEAPLREYVADFVSQQHPDMRDDESQAVIGALLDLAGHKNPRMRVLELGGDGLGYKAKEWLGILDGETAFARCRSWHTGDMADDGETTVDDGSEGPFEVLLVPKHATSRRIWAHAPPERIASLVADNGVVVTRESEAARDVWEAAGFHVLNVGKQVMLAGRKALVVLPKKRSSTVEAFAAQLATYLSEKVGVSEASIIDVDQLGAGVVPEKDTICVSLLETEHEFLATMSPEDMDRLRAMTDNVTDLIWLTGADMEGAKPDANLTLANGLSRALMLEQPALRYTLLDVGPAETGLAGSKALAAYANVVQVLVTKYDKDDCEFIDTNGVLRVSRYTPDVGVNTLFRRRMGLESEAESQKHKEALEAIGPARLTIGRAGIVDTLHFEQLSGPEHAGATPAYHVDIQVKAVSLNARDVQAMTGGADPRDKTTWTAFDFAGVVTAIGVGVSHLKVGDRAVVCAPHSFGTTARVSASSVHALSAKEDFTVVPTLLSAYSTALYAVNDRARVRAGETVFVADGSSAAGIAAIVIAQKAGALVYTTIPEGSESQAKRDYLTQELGLPASNIFKADASFAEGLKKATVGQGVDVVINNLFTGDLMHESWRSLGDFGRFIELGKRDILDAGKLDMRVFLRNVTFSAVDLSDLFSSSKGFYHNTWSKLVAEVMALYRAGEIKAPPAKVFDVSQVSQAYVAAKDPSAHVVISLENPRTRVSVAPSKYLSVFDPEKVYLLIGCLGGLGRSLSRWMMSRGARNFVFLGRSGADKPSARQLVDRLEKAGATVAVVRGDVSQAADVNAAVLACLSMGRTIGGVVQAAMGLHEALFTRMPNKAWHTGIDPKWQGTWNLHNAVEKGQTQELDFFLCTSSVSGTVGTATESNYCSANGFLDAFARWRRARGQHAVSVGLGMISEVGYLHENPEIEALLLRKGIQPLNEDEMLQVIDLALASEAAGKLQEAHMLTGLEPTAIRELAAKGFDVSSHGVLVEARAAILLGSLQAEKEAKESSKGSQGGSSTITAAPWYKDVPAALSAAFAPEADAESMQAAILQLMKKRFSNLILMPVDQIDETKPLPGFGLDSMIASEFRSWFFAVFRVDVPFLDLMSAQKSLAILADFVESKLGSN
ncbi:polyketide synthase [Stachybotrys elegans]|uniref:Polyketide synthase n=1 Tax=Stachybotrys elegans TaxID=80388 RepID=A0A8K0SV91_9HYPO|nr:polyketide synthase [Stachybotrys elegans]